MEKAEARRIIRQTLGGLTRAERQEKSAAIATHVLRLPEWGEAKVVMLYVPMAEEVDTGPILQAALEVEKNLTVPRCDPGRRALVACRIVDLVRDLSPGAYGILEPSGERRMPVERIDFVLVPGLVFDRAGRRLGRGAGYYDRFLAQPPCRAVTCAVAFDCQVWDDVPQTETDVPVHILVTESGVIRSPRV